MNRAVVAMLACAALCPSDLGAQARPQLVSFRAADGALLAGSYYEPSHRPARAVILVHMLTRNRRDWEPVAMRLAAEGIAALSFDLRGHGESPPAPTEEGATPSAMVRDVAAARQYLVSRSDVLHDRIGVAGGSLGANLALVAAAADPAVRALALLSPTLDYRGVRIQPSARKFTRPMLLVASREDAYSLRTVRELTNPKDKTSSARESLILENAGHGTGMLARDSSLIGSLVYFFQRTL